MFVIAGGIIIAVLALMFWRFILVIGGIALAGFMLLILVGEMRDVSWAVCWPLLLLPAFVCFVKWNNWRKRGTPEEYLPEGCGLLTKGELDAIALREKLDVVTRKYKETYQHHIRVPH